MENATKALTMAGGILIAIMVLATLLYAATTWGIIPTAKDETDAVKQVAEFNQQYESYARKAIYGTDLVSVLNKAIDNNKKYNVKKANDDMFINIHFEVSSDVKEIESTYRIYYSNTGKEEEPQLIGIPVTRKTIFEAGKTYNLVADISKIEEFLDKFSEDSQKGKNYRSRVYSYGIDNETGKRYKQYTETIPDASDFRTRIFACRDILDTDDNGRIQHMEFYEIDTKKED